MKKKTNIIDSIYVPILSLNVGVCESFPKNYTNNKYTYC